MYQKQSQLHPSSFDIMYQSFNLFTKEGKKWGRDFIPLSAGVNWTKASTAVSDMLHRELESAATYRNYGNAGGVRPVTDALERIECKTSGAENLAVQIVNGTTEGAWLIFEYLKSQGHIQEGDKTLMLGHGYPLYSLLSEEFKMSFHDCLACENELRNYLPSIEKIQESIEKIKPKIVFILLPNNPLGESFNEKELSKICEITSSRNIFLLIDRVCQMPWDDRESSMKILAKYILDGSAAVVDSLSKSESLAGLRVGFLIANKAIKRDLMRITKARFLNPIVFSTMTLAFCRLAEYQFKNKDSMNLKNSVKKILKLSVDELFSEYPKSEKYGYLPEEFENFANRYIAELAVKKNRLSNNFDLIHKEFQNSTRRPLILDSGFNCAFTLNSMEAEFEAKDVMNLCSNYGIGVLTERCFRTPGNNSHYFIRVGLAIEEQDFSNAIGRIKEYYVR